MSATATPPAIPAAPVSPLADPVRDIAAIHSDEWPMRPMGTFLGFRENKFQVVFVQSVLDEIHLHGQSATEIEVCGVLIGTGYRDAKGPYLLVEHCIRGNGAKARSTNVTFTAETWAHIQDVMDRNFPDKKMIGWYHTHPGFGIFLSDMDVFICDNFFNLPWQVAFVYDPLGGDEGNFIWRTGKPQREGILIEDDVTPLSAKIPLITVKDAQSGVMSAAPTSPISMAKSEKTSPVASSSVMKDDGHLDPKLVELLVRVRRLETRQKKMLTAMVFLVTFVIIWAAEFSAVPVFFQPTPTSQPAPVAKPAVVQRVPPATARSTPQTAVPR